MAEEKEEGEVQKTSGGSSVAEGGFSRGYETQIESVEKQLKKAQATLFDLQYLKEKLEIERRQNQQKALEEQEFLAAKKIKEENEKLRNELKGYQGEINSLKDIIGSLKDDLVKTAERLQDKVEDSLRAIGEEPEPHHTHHPHQTHPHIKHPQPAQENEIKKEDRNFFSDHLEVKSELEQAKEPENKPTLQETERPQAQPISNQTTPTDASEEQPAAPTESASQPTSEAKIAEQPAVEAAADTPAPSSPAAAESQPVTAVAADQNKQPAEAEATAVQSSNADSLAAQSIETAASANVTDPVPTAQQQSETIDDADLDEYEEIKRELEALEGEQLFKTSQAVEAPSPAQPVEAEPKPAKEKKSFLSFLKRKKTDEKTAAAQAEPMKEVPGEAVAEQAAAPAVAIEAAAEQPATPPVAVAQAVSAQSNLEVQPENIVVPAEHKTAKPIASLTTVFKKHKKKIKDDNNHRPRITPGAGKMAVRAAVVLLVLFSGGVAYKISNAERLRQLYISKAQDNATQTSSASSQVPDGFSSDPPEVKYKEAFAEASFDDTVWTTYKDGDLGIKLDYPQNTSYRLKPVGSLNLWFLRKNGYLLQIEKVITDQPLQQYSSEITSSIKYNVSSINVRNHPTLHLVLQDDLPVKGNIYLVKADNAIYKIWYKTFLPDENPDDEKRVKHMLDTLDFISAQE